MATLLSIPSEHVQPEVGQTSFVNKDKVIDVDKITSVSAMCDGQLKDSFYVNLGDDKILIFYSSKPGSTLRADKGNEMRNEMLNIWAGRIKENSGLNYFKFI